MASFIQLPSGNWRVQVRRKNRYVAETFRRRKDGEDWALDMERSIDRSGSPKPRAAVKVSITRGQGRVFPHNHKSVSAAFTRACDGLKIEDLHFHDLRHEGTSRLFEGGLPIEKVALVTGHKDWRTLRRYTKLKPEELHKLQTEPQPTLEEYLRTLATAQA
ncbi:integrase [Bradyrhizobium sp. USDA 4503]